eukprot:CAMPEP_0170171784 /NCGR_PEP_ID=MMETSP0040_2-20121228/4967_1 /TAXON_ID=641309 /ORGANISM="Lotharella oceanica, Strain CCMP622" /LENGTH=169 /DNA_ID=CAMNT_0010412049 /DNA_START=283 /DNA_END=789 /DNA_ORIENTATION=+
MYKFAALVPRSISSQPSGNNWPSSHGAISPGLSFRLGFTGAAEAAAFSAFLFFFLFVLKFGFSSAFSNSSSDITSVSCFSFSAVSARTDTMFGRVRTYEGWNEPLLEEAMKCRAGAILTHRDIAPVGEAAWRALKDSVCWFELMATMHAAPSSASAPMARPLLFLFGSL